MNQPTAELYMVDADEQFPYRLYAPQQDNGTYYVANVPPFVVGPDHPTQTVVPGVRLRERPDPADARRQDHLRRLQGRVRPLQRRDRAGAALLDLSAAALRQEPEGHAVPLRAAGADRGRRAQPEDRLSRLAVRAQDDRRRHALDAFSPDVTANGPEGQVTSGEPITRDMTGEEVYAALYSMRSSRLEPGVFWTGSNDGPVWVTRDNGKTWKNVTPAGLPPGGRVHTIEDSPHRKGSAYVSVYRMYLNDFKPYLYMTNDYGQHWTLLTDGTNGIPADQPMHVVREDPEQEGLLYAGTLQGAYVSFDQGKHWQTLQQNLPATPVTDFKVHHGDLLASTMGRSFWIMDNVAPLRQIAASVMKPTRHAHDGQSERAGGAGGAGGAGRPAGAAARAMSRSRRCRLPAACPCNAGAAAPTPARAASAAIKPSTDRTSSSSRRRRPIACTTSPSPGRPDHARVSAGRRADRLLPGEPVGRAEARHPRRRGQSRAHLLERSACAAPAGAAAAAAAAVCRRRCRRRSGMNRFVWDLRYPGGPATAAATWKAAGSAAADRWSRPAASRRGSPRAASTKTEPFTVKIDPRVAKDGVTVADLAEQTKFALKVRDALAEARQLAQRVRQAIDAKRGDQAKLQSIWDRLTTKSGPYEDQMFIDQLSNVGREIGAGRSEGRRERVRALQRADEGVGGAQGGRGGDPGNNTAGDLGRLQRATRGSPLTSNSYRGGPGCPPFPRPPAPSPSSPAHAPRQPFRACPSYAFEQYVAMQSYEDAACSIAS